MLSRFVIPAKRLPHLTPLMPASASMLAFTTLGRSGSTADEFLANLKLDLEDIQSFRETHGAAVIVDMFEVALPSSALTDSTQAHDLVKESSDMLNKNGIAVFLSLHLEKVGNLARRISSAPCVNSKTAMSGSNSALAA
jgi:hypothetical protein